MTETNEETISTCPAQADRNSGTTVNHQINIKNKNEDRKTFETNTALSNSENIANKLIEEEFIPRIRWPDTIAQLFLHLGCLYGFFLSLTSARFYTFLFGKC